METKTKTQAATVELSDPKPTAPIEVRPATIDDISVSVDVILDDPKADGKALQERFARRQQLIRVCFQMTSPSQWVVFKDEKTGKSTVYPQGGAADAILRHIFACTWQEKEVSLEVDKDSGEPAIARASATLYSATGKRIERFEGFREMGGFTKTKPDLIKGAFENMKSVAVRDILGLRGRTPEELALLGLDLSRTGVAEFRNNKAGSDAVPSFPWGKLKGTPLNAPSVKEKDLSWLVGVLDESIADPEKQKWRQANEKLRATALAEVARRKAPPSSAPAPAGDDFDQSESPFEPGGNR